MTAGLLAGVVAVLTAAFTLPDGTQVATMGDFERITQSMVNRIADALN